MLRQDIWESLLDYWFYEMETNLKKIEKTSKIKNVQNYTFNRLPFPFLENNNY
jgi:hypothetical protein